MDIKSNNTKSLSQMTPRQRAQTRVKALTNRMRYQSYLGAGMSSEDAARMIGVKVPFGQRVKPQELQKILEPEKKI